MGSVKLALDQADRWQRREGYRRSGHSPALYLRDRTLDFFAGAPGSVKVVAGDREYLYSLSLPQLWDSKWQPPADAHTGMPHFAAIFDNSMDVWPVVGAAGRFGPDRGMAAYGRFRRMQRSLRC